VWFAIRRGGSRDSITPLPDSDYQVLAENTRAKAWTLTVLASAALLTTLTHRQALAALAATVTRTLSISDVRYGWLSTGMAAAFLLGSLPAARLTQRIGPQITLAFSVAATSVVICLHALVTSYTQLFILRVAMGFAIAASMPAATQAVHRVLPFKDRARGVALLYAGNSVGSALCAPLSIGLESNFGWRWTFFDIAMLGVLWIPLWIVVSTYGRAQGAINSLGPPLRSITRSVPVSVLALARRKGVLRGTLLVAAAAPITLVMLIWAAKYLVHDYGVHQYDLGKYLWLPATMFGAGSLVFGELRARSARLRTNARPPRRLVILATVLACIIASAPASRSPTLSVLLGSISMMGAGGLYTLGTSDMLAHTPRDAVAAITGLTTVTQSVVYILASPIVGRIVEQFGNYEGVMVTAGVWVFPCVLVWLAEASANSRSNSIGQRSTPRR
jgi:predicted MFS family arabinose efflux permease